MHHTRDDDLTVDSPRASTGVYDILGLTTRRSIGRYDQHRYDGMNDHAIAASLSRFVGVLLLRGRLQTLLARREVGGLLCEFAKHHPRDRLMFEAFALNTVGLSYDEGRRHMQLWVHWPRCEATLQWLQDEAHRTRKPFVVPGLRKLLALAGVVGRRAAIALDVVPPEMPMPVGLPDDVATLRAIVRRLLSAQRVLRSKVVVLQGEVQYTSERARHYRREAANLRRQIRQMPKSPTFTCMKNSSAGSARCATSTLTGL